MKPRGHIAPSVPFALPQLADPPIGDTMSADPVTFDTAIAKAAEILAEASRSSTPANVQAKVAVADRWLTLASLIAPPGALRTR